MYILSSITAYVPYSVMASLGHLKEFSVVLPSTFQDYASNYKTRLLKLKFLPLMYLFKIQDILFAIKSLKITSLMSPIISLLIPSLQDQDLAANSLIYFI